MLPEGFSRYAHRTPSEVIDLNITELHRVKLACNRPSHTEGFICDTHKLSNIENAPPSVIMQNYSVPRNTTQHSDWPYILPMNNITLTF